MKDSELAARNRDVMAWGKGQISPLRKEMRSLGIRRYSGEMHRFLRDRYFRRDGRINGIGFRMPRHGVFVHKGVGRGYPIEVANARIMGGTASKTRSALDTKGYNERAIKRFMSPTGRLLGKQRKPKPWFNPIIDRSLPKLADTVAKHNADIVAHNVYIL